MSLKIEDITLLQELIKEYMINGGQSWSLITIDTYRDGGTKVLQTSVPKNALKYYINNKTRKSFDNSKFKKR